MWAETLETLSYKLEDRIADAARRIESKEIEGPFFYGHFDLRTDRQLMSVLKFLMSKREVLGIPVHEHPELLGITYDQK